MKREVASNACPCGGIACTGERLTRYGHVRGCVCRPCIGRRNRTKGQRGQRVAHRALGGTGFTPSNEESGRAYELTVQAEVKAGGQVPAKFTAFVGSEWFRHALSQAERAIPEGVTAKPAVVLLPEGGGTWAVVRL